MQMQDTLRHIHGGPDVAVLAEAFEVAPAKADAALRAVMREMAWHMERNTLSRGVLADLVEALGSVLQAGYIDDANALRGEMVRMDGNAVLAHVLSTKDRSRALAARAAREAGTKRAHGSIHVAGIGGYRHATGRRGRKKRSGRGPGSYAVPRALQPWQPARGSGRYPAQGLRRWTLRPGQAQARCA